MIRFRFKIPGGERFGDFIFYKPFHLFRLAMNVDPYLNPNSQIQLLARRLMGALPHIDIAGIDFTVDWRLRELRETAEPWNKIDLNLLSESESGEEYLGLYDTKEKQLYDLDDNITTVPENVVGLEIPHEIKLDPVAVAREYGIDIVQFVQLNPIVKDMKALIRPITETGLPEMVAENLRKSQNSEQNLGRKMGR
jgi:hypothetical protein